MTQQSEEQVIELIDQIYDAALTPERWGAVLERIGRQIDATSGTSLWFGQSGLQLVRADIWNVSDEALRDYQLHYLAFCPRYRASRDLKAGTIYDDQAQRASSSGLLSEYYSFVDKHEIGKANIALVEKSAELTIGVNFYCSATKEFDSQAESVLSILMPHLRRATSVTSKYLDVISQADFGDALFNARLASLTVDRSGRVVRVNPSAEAVLARKDGISLVNGHLVASSLKDNVALQEQIGLATQPDDLRRARMVQSILINRPSGLAPYSVEVSVLQRRDRLAQEVALVSITEASVRLRLDHLRTAFRLTEAEIDVVSMLHSGLRPEQIADARRTSVQTVRSQIKSVFSKTGVRSQIELVTKFTGS